MAEEWSRDRSSSAESQPKFPGCSHFRRRNDNHLRWQQCRLNEGQPLCTQDRPCLVCKDWLPEAWAAQAKANAQKNRRKAAAVAKAAKKASEETMDNSVEIHAPEEAIQLPSKRSKSEGSSKTKWTKTKATTSESSQPKSVVSSLSVVGRPSSHGSDRRRSRSPERKQRTTRGRQMTGFSKTSVFTAWRLPARERVVPAKFLWRFQLPEACRVRQSLQGVGHPSVGLFLSTSSSFFGWSSIPFINFISGVSRPQVFAQSREKMRESADWTGQTYVTRWDVKLYPKSSKPPEKRTITVVSSPARQVHSESAPEVPVPAPVADGPAGADPAAGNGSDTGGSPATRNGTATGNCTATGNRTATCDGSDTDDGPATGDGPSTVDDPASDDPADVSEVESELQFDKPDETDGPACHPTEARLGTPAVTSPGDGPDVSRSTGTSSLLFPSIPRNTGRLYVDVDVTTASDGPVQCSSCSSLSSGPRRLELQREYPSLQRGFSILHRVPSVLFSGGPESPREKPGLPWDKPGHPWDNAASPGNPDHVPHYPDPRQ